MFYIHGGGFCDGSGNDDFLGPDFLIENDVLVVRHNVKTYVEEINQNPKTLFR